MKQKFRFPLNLQLFAEDEEVPNQHLQFEIEDDTQDPPPTMLNEDGSIEVDFGNEEETEETPDETDEQQEDGLSSTGAQRESEEEVKDNSTKNAVIAERRKWQERMKAMEKKASIADKLMQSSGVNDVDELQRQFDAMESQRYQDQGLDPHTANMLVQQQRQLADMQSSLNRQKYDVEVEKLKADPFFADIEDWRDELEPYAQRTGQTLEQAYMGLRGRERMTEYRRELEQRMQASQSKKQSARINTSTSGGAVKTKQNHGLTSDQLTMATLAGMKPEEYAKYVKK